MTSFTSPNTSVVRNDVGAEKTLPYWQPRVHWEYRIRQNLIKNLAKVSRSRYTGIARKLIDFALILKPKINNAKLRRFVCESHLYSVSKCPPEQREPSGVWRPTLAISFYVICRRNFALRLDISLKL